jgi:hypothetical protein
MKVGDPCMPDKSLEAQNWFLACYAVSLIQGETLKGISIRSKTVKHYIQDAVGLFKSRSLPNPLKLKYDKKCNITLVTRALEAVETVPDRRHMIHDSMMHWLVNLAKSAGSDSHIQAMVDWFILGRYTGFRKSEWCQSTQSKYATRHGTPSP